jgi:DNA-binding IclR family transcriptional regulator
MRRIRAAAIGPASRVAEETGGIAVVSQMLGSQQVPVLVKQARPLEGAGAEDLAQVSKPHPLWATASGRALLGSLPPAQRARLLPDTVPQLTPHTAPSRTEIKTAIRTGVKDGMHVDEGEVCRGLWCCSVALDSNLADASLAIAAISLYEPDPAQVARVRRALRRESCRRSSR